MAIKPQTLTYSLYVAFLIVIIASTWVVRRSPDAINWVGIGLAVFVGLMVVVVAIFTKKTAAK
jgi:hypothetical protein